MKKDLDKKEKKAFQKLSDIAEVEKMSVIQRQNFFDALNDYLEIHLEIVEKVSSEL